MKVEFLILLCVLFVVVCAVYFITDLAMTIYRQFRGKDHKWKSIEVLKDKREWWKWVIAIAAFAIGVFFLIPISITGKADFRAEFEKPSYTAYYECEYRCAHTGRGTGYVALTRDRGEYRLDCLYTDYGKIYLDYEFDNKVQEDVSLIFCGGECECDITIGAGPVDDAFMNEAKYANCLGQPDCSDENVLECARCYELCEKWTRLDDYVLCEHCLEVLFDDERMREVVEKYEEW